MSTSVPGPCMIAPVIVELLRPHTGRAFEALRELRPALLSRDGFVQQVDDRQRPAGYRLIASVVEDATAPLAVAGFRVGDNLAWATTSTSTTSPPSPRRASRGTRAPS
jgi:hypothetical protein